MVTKGSKVLLRNIIRHTGVHNRMMEEQDMWRRRPGDSDDNNRHQERAPRYSDDSSLDGSRGNLRSSCRQIARAHMDREDETQPHSYGGREEARSTFWVRQLQKVEEADPSRWGHGGFKDMYPSDFDSDRSDGDSRQRSRNGKKTSRKQRSRKTSERRVSPQHQGMAQSNGAERWGHSGFSQLYPEDVNGSNRHRSEPERTTAKHHSSSRKKSTKASEKRKKKGEKHKKRKKDDHHKHSHKEHNKKKHDKELVWMEKGQSSDLDGHEKIKVEVTSEAHGISTSGPYPAKPSHAESRASVGSKPASSGVSPGGNPKKQYRDRKKDSSESESSPEPRVVRRKNHKQLRKMAPSSDCESPRDDYDKRDRSRKRRHSSSGSSSDSESDSESGLEKPKRNHHRKHKRKNSKFNQQRKTSHV